MAPGVPILLYCKFRYLRDSLKDRAALMRSALGAPKEFPWRLRLSIFGHFSIYFAKISMPISEISLKERSTCLSNCFSALILFNDSQGLRIGG
jgi:hypothetical protein